MFPSIVSIGSVLSELDLNAIIVPGGFGDRGVEAKIETVRFARKEVPFLGICLGFQMAVIEFARHRPVSKMPTVWNSLTRHSSHF